MTISHRGGFSSEYSLLATLQTTGASGNGGTGAYSTHAETEAIYQFQWASGKSPLSGQWTTLTDSRSQQQSQSHSTSWDATGTWTISGGEYSLAGTYSDQSSQLQSNSSSSEQTFNPSTGQHEYRSSNSHSNSSSIERLAQGSGGCSHNRHGFEVSGAASTLSSFSL